MTQGRLLRVDSWRLEVGESLESLRRRLLRDLELAPEDVQSYRLVRRSLDARKKSDIHYELSIEICLRDAGRAEAIIAAGLAHAPRVRERDRDDREILDGLRHGHEALEERPVVVGSGPGGLFAAWLLAREGYHPLIVDRGPAVAQRVRALRVFERGGAHDPENNILFGEGGAGTFSDGKLTSRSRSPLVGLIHQILLDAGAPPDIAFEAKAHIGTDRLRAALVFLRRAIEKMGGSFSFQRRLEDLKLDEAGSMRAIRIADGSTLPCRVLLLAPGHSARDTVEALLKRGVAIEFKEFQAGLRIEHPQEMIDRAQFGDQAGRLPPAEYVLNDRSRGIFSFCMCPGGHVVASISEPEFLCTNGMSRRRRSSPWANAALMMTVGVEVAGASDVLGGLRLQRRLERRGFELGGGDYVLPAQRAADFLKGRLSVGGLESSYKRGLKAADLREILPSGGAEELRAALEVFDRRIPGFISEGLLVGPETRGSSPVRLPRDRISRESLSTPGLYPVGEGAGAAGGIISSGLDGLRSAAALIRKYEAP